MNINKISFWSLLCETENKSIKVHLIAILTFLLIILALFWRVFFLGETLIDLATHSNQLPWGASISTYDNYPYSRRDLTDTYVTRDYFIVDSYSNGELPLWNPYILGGHPIYADGVTKIFNPTHLLYLYFNIPLGYTLARLLELFLTAIFTYVFLINLRLNPGSAFIGTIVFILSDHVMQHLTWLGWLGGLMWLPLILLCAEQALKNDKTLFAIGGGIALALQFYCGYTPTAIYYLTALILYYLINPFLQNLNVNRLVLIKIAIKHLIITLIIGFGLSAINWWPVFELLSFSNRKIVPTEIGYIWLPPWYLPTLIFPRILGRAFEPAITKQFVDIGVSQDHIIYLGVVSLIFISFTFWQQSWNVKDKKIYYFILITIGALAVMMLTPFYVHITKYLPVLKTIRATTRISGIYAFGGAVLTAYGAHYLLTTSWSEIKLFIQKVKSIMIILLLIIIFFISLFMFLGGLLPNNIEKFSGVVNLSFRILNSFKQTLSFNNIDIIVSLIILATITIILYFLLSTKEDKNFIFILIMFFILLIELIWQGNQYNQTFQTNLIYKENKTVTFIKNNLKYERLVVAPIELKEKAENFDGDSIIAPPNTLLPYKINIIYGKDQLFPKWYREFTSLSEKQEHLSHIVFSRISSPLYDFLGVKYLMTKENNIIQENSYKEVYLGEGVKIYENQNMKPRAFFAKNIQVASDISESFREMKKKDFDINLTTIVTDKSFNINNILPSEINDIVEIKEYINNKIVLNTKANGTRLLVLTDTYYPGWEVFIDGQQTNILRVNHAFRGVEVKSGEHKIEFRFRPKSFYYGAFISCSTLLLVLGFTVFNIVKSRKFQ
jgi:hypothetical protein